MSLRHSNGSWFPGREYADYLGGRLLEGVGFDPGPDSLPLGARKMDLGKGMHPESPPIVRMAPSCPAACSRARRILTSKGDSHRIVGSLAIWHVETSSLSSVAPPTERANRLGHVEHVSCPTRLMNLTVARPCRLRELGQTLVLLAAGFPRDMCPWHVFTRHL